jgi:hypothetical protein
VNYDRETRADIRRDMLRDCGRDDRGPLGRCRWCGGTLLVANDATPATCECEEPERESSHRFFRDEDDDG